MSIIDKINRSESRYIDLDQQIEYVFLGFRAKLSFKEKRKLIARRGKPCKIPLQPRHIKTELGTISLPKPRFECQVILKREAKDSPNVKRPKKRSR